MVMWLLTCPLADRNSRHLQNKLTYLHKHSNRAQLFSVTCARFGRITKVKLSESTYPIYANSESSTSTQRCEISHISKPTGLTTITVSCALFCFLKKNPSNYVYTEKYVSFISISKLKTYTQNPSFWYVQIWTDSDDLTLEFHRRDEHSAPDLLWEEGLDCQRVLVRACKCTNGIL